MMKIVVVTGPTASGKTSLAIELAKAIDAEIVSCDSQLVYRGLDIGTAKPTSQELSAVPHHLIDVVEIDQPYNVGTYVADADGAINQISSRGKNIIVTGGTALYLKGLLHGIMEGPPRDEALRAQLEQRWERERLWDELMALDPKSAQTLNPNDKTRVVRALEVYRLTGRSIRDFQQGHGFSEHKYDARLYGIDLPREELYRRINERVDAMMEAGWLEEVRGVLNRGYPPTLSSLSAIGYRKLSHFLQNGGDLGETVEKIKQDTRQFAKRQMTWFRKMPIKWLAPGDNFDLMEDVNRFLG